MRRDKRPPLMVSVWAELGAARFIEDYIIDKAELVDGYIEDASGHIYINPVPAVVETLIHEILHRLHWEDWGESYVRNRTTFLMKRMTDSEIQQFYDEYQRRVRRRKRAKRGVRQADSGNTRSTQLEEPRLCRGCRSVEQSAEVRSDGSAGLEGRAGEVDG